MKALRAGLKLLFWEKKDATGLKDIFTGKAPASVALLVGPEGGLSDDDVLMAEKAGFLKAGMGPRVLRAETAAIAAAALAQHAFGDLG